MKFEISTISGDRPSKYIDNITEESHERYEIKYCTLAEYKSRWGEDFTEVGHSHEELQEGKLRRIVTSKHKAYFVEFDNINALVLALHKAGNEFILGKGVIPDCPNIRIFDDYL